MNEGVTGKRVSVVGAARSGIAAARLLRAAGATVFVSEKASEETMGSAAAELRALGVQYEFGANTGKVLEGELIVLSPGVPSDAAIVTEALKRGSRVVSELEAASWFCPGPIVAITGTNGKTTTTTLLGRMFDDARKPAIVAGNIGVAFSQVVGAMAEGETAIVETSSFQLDYITSFRPKVAILMNITPDHLDRYHYSFERYVASKCKVFENQRAGDVIVYNDDDDVVRTNVEHGVDNAVNRLPFSIKRRVDHGAFVAEGHLQIDVAGTLSDIIATKSISIPGNHNLYNAMAATLAGTSMGIMAASLRGTLKNFRGVEHRLEFVRLLRGVTYINDSKGTNVDAVWYALQSFSAPIILMLGGRDKGNDYTTLFDLVKLHVKAIIAIGESADKVEQTFTPLIGVTRAGSMEEAVHAAAKLSVAGDIVLLSPACASFDWFENYEHRGRVFKQIVMNMAD